MAVTVRNYDTEMKLDLLDAQHVSRDTGMISILMDLGGF